MKKQIVTAILAVGALLPLAASAAPIVLSSSASQTTAGQNFTFNFAGLAPSDGGGATFSIGARGDYAGGTSETLTWSIDGGLASGGPLGGWTPGFTCAGTGIGGPFDFCTTFGDNDIQWQRTYAISAGTLSSMLANSALSIVVNLNSSVNRLTSSSGVNVSFSYNSQATAVPEPGTLALLGLGLAGLGLVRRKRAA